VGSAHFRARGMFLFLLFPSDITCSYIVPMFLIRSFRRHHRFRALLFQRVSAAARPHALRRVSSARPLPAFHLPLPASSVSAAATRPASHGSFPFPSSTSAAPLPISPDFLLLPVAIVSPFLRRYLWEVRFLRPLHIRVLPVVYLLLIRVLAVRDLAIVIVN
jgi:hypothetical protein